MNLKKLITNVFEEIKNPLLFIEILNKLIKDIIVLPSIDEKISYDYLWKCIKQKMKDELYIDIINEEPYCKLFFQ